MPRLNGLGVLQVIPAVDAGGAERTTVEIARAVVAAGGRAVVASAGGRLVPEIEAAGAVHVTANMATKNPVSVAMNIRALERIAQSHEVAILHARSRAPAWSALAAARRLGLGFVTTYHGAYRAGGPVKRFYNSVMTRGDVVIANSGFTAAAIRAATGLSEERLRPIPRGVDLETFDPAKIGADRKGRLATSWGLPAEKEARGDVVLLPARLTPWKGQRVAVDAFKVVLELVDGRDEPSLIICGDPQGRDGYVEELQLAISRANLHTRVKLVGHCEDMPAAYALADVVLAPSVRPEAFGRTAAEAGAMGAPVIASSHGGALEVVQDGETGVLTRPGDVGELTAALHRLLGEAGRMRRRELGEAARRHIRDAFSVTAMGDATLAVYQTVAAMRGSHRV